MPVRLLLAVTIAATALVTASPAASPAMAAGAPVVLHRACLTAVGHDARCFAAYSAAGPAARGAPKGYGPADITAAYRLPTGRGAGQVVAIVDAYDNPKAEADLALYRSQFGLPPCTTGNGCLRKVNQRGATSPLPTGDAGWGVEIALDLDAVSAACPHCSILLVEGDSSSLPSLGRAVDTAVRLGASIVSNSYGTAEFTGMARYAGHYRHDGVPILAATGDDGFTAASFPAVGARVIAVGGTSLRHTSAGWQERAWAGGGSGCSAYVTKPAWQPAGHCPMRLTADVSAVADPRTGVAVYDTYGLGADSGWLVVGGTSAATPLVAGMIGLAGNATSIGSARYLYTHRRGFTDIVGGANGFCGGDYLCTALPGYDAPTGVGSPLGVRGL